jgi:hypothetical protein
LSFEPIFFRRISITAGRPTRIGLAIFSSSTYASMSLIGRVATPESIAALRHGRRDAQDQARIERLRDQVVGAEAQLVARIGRATSP